MTLGAGVSNNLLFDPSNCTDISLQDIATYNGAYWELNQNTTINEDECLTINTDEILLVGGLDNSGPKLTNNGIINNNGTIEIYQELRLINNGLINNLGLIDNNEDGIENKVTGIINNSGGEIDATIFGNGGIINNGVIYNPLGQSCPDGTINNQTIQFNAPITDQCYT